MRTLYIDVYFLINFTVDLLALYFAAMLSRAPTSTKRLIFASIVGAVFACAIVFLPEYPILKLVLSLLTLVVIAFIAEKKVRFLRRVKFLFCFVMFEALVGGAVTYIWGLFDHYLVDIFSAVKADSVNRKMLFLSVIVLLSIGVFKMLISFLSRGQSDGVAELNINFLNRNHNIKAFVDSGNLAVDPMDLSPIILIKKNIAKDILPENIIDLCDIDKLDSAIKKRIRLIPITRGGETHVLMGIKADRVLLLRGDMEDEINVTIAIDKEGGSYGGYDALVPSCIFKDAIL